jgi:hypothetical protein
MRAYRGLTAAMAGVTAGLGAAMLVVTAVRGGGIGFVIGALFLAAGGGRLYLLRRRG